MRKLIAAALLSVCACGFAQQVKDYNKVTIRDGANKPRVILDGGTITGKTAVGAQTFDVDSATGVGTFAGLGTTPLDATKLTGTVDDARLSGNVSLLGSSITDSEIAGPVDPAKFGAGTWTAATPITFDRSSGYTAVTGPNNTPATPAIGPSGLVIHGADNTYKWFDTGGGVYSGRITKSNYLDIYPSTVDPTVFWTSTLAHTFFTNAGMNVVAYTYDGQDSGTTSTYGLGASAAYFSTPHASLGDSTLTASNYGSFGAGYWSTSGFSGVLANNGIVAMNYGAIDKDWHAYGKGYSQGGQVVGQGAQYHGPSNGGGLWIETYGSGGVNSAPFTGYQESLIMSDRQGLRFKNHNPGLGNQGDLSASFNFDDSILTSGSLECSGTLVAAGGLGSTSLNASNLGSGTIPYARLGAFTTTLGQTIESLEITDGTIADADISSTSSISLLGQTIESSEITDGAILNADINASAAIADTKLATISTAGKVSDSALSSNIPLKNGTNTFSGANDFSQGAVSLSNGTSNRLQFGTAGVAAPDAASAGMKIKLYGANGSMGFANYGFGVESGYIWSYTDYTGGYKWYASNAGNSAAVLYAMTNATGLAETGRIAAGTTTIPTSGAYVQSNGGISDSSVSAGIGYATGAGGTVSQSTDKSTGVTIDRVCGTITMNAATLNAGTIVSFTVTDASMAATDLVILNHTSGGTLGAYTLNAAASASGSFQINVRNETAGNLSEAIVIRFAIIKGVTS
jgi:hypothetical protein